VRNAARPQRFESGIYLIGTSPAIRMLSMRASAREAPRLATGKKAGQLVRADRLAVKNDRLCVCVSVCLYVFGVRDVCGV
jgi:hypothetical protein